MRQMKSLRLSIKEVKPDYLQLHGSETVERVQEIFKLFQTPIIKAIGVSNSDDAAFADHYTEAEIILFDAKADPKLTPLPGGNGIPFDWTALKGPKRNSKFYVIWWVNPSECYRGGPFNRGVYH